jgi:hypothetical protein
MATRLVHRTGRRCSATALIREKLREATGLALSVISHRLALIPCVACGCGKPVVFTNGRRNFTCTHCGAKYRLTVAVKQVSASKL